VPAGAPLAPARRAGAEGEGIAHSALSVLRSAYNHRAIDRLLAGRIWIGLVAFALIGIVTLQLGLLKLNNGIGHALEHEGVLQRQNAALSVENSELAAGTRVESTADHLGMTLVPVGALRFLRAHDSGDIGKASNALSTHVEVPPPVEVTTAESSSAAEAGESQETSAGSEESASEAAAGEAPVSESGTGEAEAEESSVTSSGETSESVAAAGGAQAE
jgi:hypothetical protein